VAFALATCSGQVQHGTSHFGSSSSLPPLASTNCIAACLRELSSALWFGASLARGATLQIFHSSLEIEVVTKGCIFTKSGLDLNLCGLFFEAVHFYYQAVLIPAVVRTKIRECLGEFGGWWSLSLGGYGVHLVTSPRSDDPV
jgi:hypothetical protein